MSVVHYDSYTAARDHLKDVLDTAESGQVVTVRRDSATAAVLSADRLRHFLASVVPSRVEVVAETDGWSAFIPGLPVAAAAADYDAAIADVVDALREYAKDWPQLQHAPNHRENWGLVQLVTLSDDEQLRRWITGSRQ
ncbi:MAG TPA: prevent-host-death protein [Streptosporangiaceae bacterium]|nr:prevent-host-death protein [Streptosporangiaceae bacterium]